MPSARRIKKWFLHPQIQQKGKKVNTQYTINIPDKQLQLKIPKKDSKASKLQLCKQMDSTCLII
jgi:hypothetical protein